MNRFDVCKMRVCEKKRVGVRSREGGERERAKEDYRCVMSS